MAFVLGLSLAFVWLRASEIEREIAGFPPESLPYQAEYVGSETCGSCHAEHWRQQSSHPMALTGQKVTAETRDLWFSEERLRRPVEWPRGQSPVYRPTADGVLLEAGDGAARVGAVLGSGSRGFTPISAEPGRTIRELRLSFSAPHDSWFMTPGSERDRDLLGTPKSAEESRNCLECHATLLAWRNDVLDFDESRLGVECERCHGPGSAHVDAVRAGNPSAIFNPGALRADRQVEFCGQCHRQPFDIDPLDAMSRDPSMARHAGAGLMLSECFRRSPRDTTVSCLNCHDPHGNIETTAHRSRASCLRCHLAADRDHRSHSISSYSDCVSCHMRVEERGISAIGFTDHWIRIPGSPLPVDSFEREEYLEYLENDYRRGLLRPVVEAEEKAKLGLGLAEIQFARENHQNALRTLREALSAHPSYAQRLRAAALFRQGGRIPEAIEVLEDAIQSGPEPDEAYYQLGELLQLTGKLDEAASRYRQALALNPDSAVALNSLGSVLGSQGDFEEARTHFQRALELKPAYPEARRNLGLALQRLGRLEAARTQFELALQASPDWPAAQSALARILATHPDPDRRDPQRAVRLADRAAELTRYENPTILDTLAAAYAAAGQFERATAVAEEALRLATDVELAGDIRARLSLYKDKKPYVEAPRN
ncbi:MAG TPA: tetratricopeptide repeat protein [Vicinamibacteria bacterium]|nr:tetratricopeptide repeat protein [Vicinamibacteria bacterium]